MNGRPSQPIPRERPILPVSTATFDEIAAKLRRLDRFDLVEGDALILGHVCLTRLTPGSLPNGR